MSAILLPHGSASKPKLYIQSDGNQYINTGYKTNINTSIIIHGEFTDYIEEQTIYGAGDDTFGGMCLDLKYDGKSNKVYGGIIAHSYFEFSDNFLVTEKEFLAYGYYDGYFSGNYHTHEYIMIGEGAFGSKGRADGKVVLGSISSTSRPLYIFARNNNGIADRHSRIKLYYMAIQEWSDSGIKRIKEYIPTVDTNGVACLYDTINHQYAYNAGTGQFICGIG